jgi:hypothetical protein
VEHIISACPILAQEQYIKRHDEVCVQLHFNIYKEIGVKLDNKHRYDHVPKSFETSHEGKVTILWNKQVQSDRTIPNNKPDIIIRDDKKGTCMLIDIAFSGDRNVIKIESEKILTYKNVVTEIQPMWNVKANVILAIIGAIGTISESLRQYLSKIQGKHEIKDSKKQPCCALHTSGSANVKVQIIQHGK